MNCNCFKETEDKLKERVMQPDANPPKGGTVTSVACSNMALFLRAGKCGYNVPFSIHWTGSKKKETTVNVKASFCPFCGKETGD